MKQWRKIEIASGNILKHCGQEIFIPADKHTPAQDVIDKRQRRLV
jgi:hypothetical protein